jgi:hypothetical protein
MRRISIVLGALALSLLLTSGAAHALELDEAKQAGLVGETMEGYLGAVADSPGPEVVALVNEINAKRRAEYRRIAEEHGIELEQVEVLAAKKAIEKTPPGGWIRIDGSWRRK